VVLSHQNSFHSLIWTALFTFRVPVSIKPPIRKTLLSSGL